MQKFSQIRTHIRPHLIRALVLASLCLTAMPSLAQADQICYDTGPTRICRSRTIATKLPFTGTRYFNFMGGSGTGRSLTLQSDGTAILESQGLFGSSVIYRGKFSNPLVLPDEPALLIEGNKIYSLRPNGQIAQGCKKPGQPCEALLSAPAVVPQELSFWPGPNAAADRRVTRLSMHPCGQVAIAQVTKIPPINTNQALQPETVTELAANGRVLKQWATPVDSYPIAIRDNRLLVEVSRTEPLRLWIDLEGNMSTAVGIPLSTTNPPGFKCGDKGLQRCSIFKDLASGTARTLKFDGVCS